MRAQHPAVHWPILITLRLEMSAHDEQRDIRDRDLKLEPKLSFRLLSFGSIDNQKNP